MLRFQHHPKHLLCPIDHSMVMILLVAGNAKVLMDFVGTNGLSEICFLIPYAIKLLCLRPEIHKCKVLDQLPFREFSNCSLI